MKNCRPGDDLLEPASHNTNHFPELRAWIAVLRVVFIARGRVQRWWRTPWNIDVTVYLGVDWLVCWYVPL